MKRFLNLLLLSLVACQAQPNPADQTGNSSIKVDVRDARVYPLSCDDSEAVVASQGGPRLTFGNTALYMGTQQVGATNQDPRVVRFDNAQQVWCRDDLETSGDDSRGFGLLWDGREVLYAVFSATGTQGEPSGDFRRFTQNGWLTSYADASAGGGGPKVTLIAKLDPATGDVLAATYLTAVKPSDRKINSLIATNLSYEEDRLSVRAAAYYSPRQVNLEPFTCSGNSPFKYTVVFDADLSRALSAEAEGCEP